MEVSGRLGANAYGPHHRKPISLAPRGLRLATTRRLPRDSEVLAATLRRTTTTLPLGRDEIAARVVSTHYCARAVTAMSDRVCQLAG